MDVSSYFKDFLSNIRPTETQKDDLQKGHRTLRERLKKDEDIGPIVISTFLQGSYRRATAVKPKGDERPDVDVIVVADLDIDKLSPNQAMNKFLPFLKKHYEGKFRMQGRSIGISLSYVDMDLVITVPSSEDEKAILQSEAVNSYYDLEEIWNRKPNNFWGTQRDVAPGVLGELKMLSEEVQGWRSSRLHLPDRKLKQWKPTDPLAQISWTSKKNASCNGHYVNVVKALKWWRINNNPEGHHPKSYPLEHLLGVCCPDGIESVAKGVIMTLEKIITCSPRPWRSRA